MAPIIEKRSIRPRKESLVQQKPLTREETMIDSLSPILNVMVKSVRKAGRKMLRDFGEISNLQIMQKTPGDFVSNADLLSEKILMESLSEVYPDYGFFCEEKGIIPPKNSCEYSWIIDPIDGTINFIHAIPQFAISLALQHQGDIVAAVLFNPITNNLYYAEKGKGAFVLTPTGVMRLRVSGRSRLDTALIGSNGVTSKANQLLVSKLYNKISSLRYTGSISLSLASVACGQFEGYVSTCFGIWDIATGFLLIKEAGGCVTDFSGNSDLNEIVKKQELFCSNMLLKQKLFTTLTKD